MRDLMQWADQLAGEILGEHCGCYGENFPSRTCDLVRSIVAIEIAKGFLRNHGADLLADSALRGGCACYDHFEQKWRARDRDETADKIEAAFLARHMAEAHEQAIEQERTGG